MYLLIKKNSVLPFSMCKKYPVGTGYLLLYDETEADNLYCLCRVLDKEELQIYKTKQNFSYICDTEHTDPDHDAIIPTIPVAVLCQPDSMEEADEVVESYKKGLKALEVLENL